MNKPFILSAFALAYSLGMSAQGTITIEPQVQRFLGEESTLAREKFVSFHALFDKEDADFDQFKQDYNVPYEYRGSRRFFYPIAKTKGGKIPKVQQKYEGTRSTHNYVVTAPPGALFYDKTINYGTTDFMPYIKDVANYVADAFVSEWDQVPSYLEPFNEPMVHAPDFAKGLKGEERKAAIEAVVTYVCQYHKEVARAVKSRPELKDMQVMGFGSAYPELEANNFGLWNSRFKQFIDIAGEDIDILSFHLYDGSGINNQGGRRSGSNLEAIMDILQTYSFIKQGKPMPMAVTEYGRLVPNQPAWEKATGAVGNKLDKPVKTSVSNYHPVTNSQAVRSQLHMVMAFMNRQDELVNTIPFTIGKSPQNVMYAKSSLWVKQEDGTFEYSNRRLFFEMMKDLEGEQVAVNSSNIDVQALGYVKGRKLYVMLNNLNDEAQTVDLSLAPAGNLKGGNLKTLKIFENKEPELQTTKFKTAPKQLTLAYGETAVITYEYKKNIDFNASQVRQKFFSKDYLKPIKAGQKQQFGFEGVAAGEQVILRLGVNRDHKWEVLPSLIQVNGKEVKISQDVIKGYDQKTRKQFFGSLEIPVPAQFVKAGKNTVTTSFAQGNGFVTTAILQVISKK